MKIVKYLIAALLVISITKKIHVTPDQLEFYDAISKTAKMSNGDTYVGIVEYNRSTTPPNIANPTLKLFTQISTQNYSESTPGILGGLSAMTSLYGIPVIGESFHIKSNKQTIGTYWPINKVAQLHDGKTFVAIIEEQTGNYKKHGYHALGPIWTRFDATELAKMYNIDTSDVNFKKYVKTIGTTTKHKKQNFKLYGVLLNSSLSTPIHQSFLNQIENSTSIKKETLLPKMDSFTEKLRTQTRRAYSSLGQNKHSDTFDTTKAAIYSILAK